jgi:dienelactone hydrolase
MATSTGLTRRTPTRRIRAFGVFVAALALLSLAAGSASATITDRSGRVTQPYSFVSWDWNCGYPMQVTGTTTDQVQVRVDRKDPRIVFVTDNYQFRETRTVADGRSFQVEGNGLAKDVRAKSLGGSLYEFTFHNAGQPFTISDSSGNLISRDRGIFEFKYTINLDDGTFNFVGLRVSGPHPSAGVDYCSIVAPLVGTGSASHLTPRPVGSTTFPMGYYEYLPPSYTADGAKSPLLLAFNGYGESGDGSPEQLPNLLNTGIPRFINIGGWPADRPLVVLALQHFEEPPGFPGSSCDGQPWIGSCGMQLQHDRDNAQPAFCTTPDEVHNFIDYAVAHYNVDPKRVYITGLSCGAYGVWEYLAKYHASLQVAAAIPIAGDARPAWSPSYCGLGSTPLWAFNGALDDVVNPLGSTEPMNALANCGVPADHRKLTTYPDLFHDGWDQAYSGSRGDDIYSWMLGFSMP